MTAERTLLVGGLSSLHDPLCAAALCGIGLPAVALHPRTDEGLRRARSLGNHGQCNPAHYAVGAVLEHARRSGMGPAEFAANHSWLTVGSCGPCRLAAFDFEYARVLGGAGLGRLPVVLLEQLAFVEGESSGPLQHPGPSVAEALVDAVVAGDVVATLGHTLRPYALDPSEVDALLATTIGDLTGALHLRAPLVPCFDRARIRALAIARDQSRVLPRILLVGEPWTTLADGDPSYDLARRLALSGAEVEAPTATDWLAYRLWTARRDAEAAPAGSAGVRLRSLGRADRRLRRTWSRLAGAAAIDAARPACHDALAKLARPHYDPDLRGGSAHLEVARAVLAARDRTAHVVLSLKPFGCLPSSDLSDGILSVLLRKEAHVRFLALETTGSGDAAAESRLDMALLSGTLAALHEFEVACVARGLTPSAARVELEARGPTTSLPTGARMFACTAAELLHRGPGPSGRAGGGRSRLGTAHASLEPAQGSVRGVP